MQHDTYIYIDGCLAKWLLFRSLLHGARDFGGCLNLFLFLRGTRDFDGFDLRQKWASVKYNVGESVIQYKDIPASIRLSHLLIAQIECLWMEKYGIRFAHMLFVDWFPTKWNNLLLFYFTEWVYAIKENVRVQYLPLRNNLSLPRMGNSGIRCEHMQSVDWFPTRWNNSLLFYLTTRV